MDWKKLSKDFVDHSLEGIDGESGGAETEGGGNPSEGSEGNSPWRPGTSVRSLVSDGDENMKKGDFAEAISAYTAALRLDDSSKNLLGCLGRAAVLANRSLGFAELSLSLRVRPAEESERHALFGQDPMQLAELALRDAEKSLTLNKHSSRAHTRKAVAAVLLEDYPCARDALLEGMSLDPSSARALSTRLSALDAMVEAPGSPEPKPESDQGRRLSRSASKRKRTADPDLDDCECTLCYKLLYEPVTTPCGHSFCKDCFQRAMDHQPRCPLCRTVLHIARKLPVTVTLAALLKACFPEEYEERAKEAAATGLALQGATETEGDGGEETVTLPLFTMSPLFPGASMALNIFEPRYRLMVRRVMEGSRKFGMAVALRTLDGGTELHHVATEAEITECTPQTDGRFYLEIKGIRRVRIQDSWEMDGYRVARVVPLKDEVVEEGSDEAERVRQLVKEVREGTVDTLANLQRMVESGGLRPRQRAAFAEIVQRGAEMPGEGESPENFSIFVSSLLPLETSVEMQLLSTTRTEERLSVLRETFGAGGGGSCCVM